MIGEDAGSSLSAEADRAVLRQKDRALLSTASLVLQPLCVADSKNVRSNYLAREFSYIHSTLLEEALPLPRGMRAGPSASAQSPDA
jgi:hypothetical protein